MYRKIKAQIVTPWFFPCAANTVRGIKSASFSYSCNIAFKEMSSFVLQQEKRHGNCGE